MKHKQQRKTLNLNYGHKDTRTGTKTHTRDDVIRSALLYCITTFQPSYSNITGRLTSSLKILEGKPSTSCDVTIYQPRKGIGKLQ